MKNTKNNLHPRNKHRNRYDFPRLIMSSPNLAKFVKENKYGDESIDFSDPKAVLALNTALLEYFYNLDYWEIPKGYLCPPVPGRADYVHYAADLINRSGFDKKISDNRVKCLDIGVGANCIYPIVGVNEYNWSFVGTDIDAKALNAARDIVEKNKVLEGRVELRLQANPKNIFKGIIKKADYFDLVICNPPFHSSQKEARTASVRKVSNLKGKRINNPNLNFGGMNSELWCEGGEKRFVKDMIFESQIFADKIRWFTSLISKKDNLPSIYSALRKVKIREVKTIQMGQGNKISRIVAWRF